MGTRDGLEAALLASWDRETLAVYADHLQGLGDPRGELISLDLELATRTTPELVQRRTSLMTAWLGRLVPSNPHTPWVGDTFKFGFVDDLRLEEHDEAEVRLAQVLASPLAPYLKRVTIVGSAPHVATMLTALAGDHEHPWLTELAVRVEAAGPVAPEAVTRFIAATPSLQRLDVYGVQVFAEFPHPGVQRLRVTGGNAIAGLFNDGDPMLGVRELDLAFDLPDAGYGAASGPIGALELPALRVLDLSRNEPEARRMPYTDEDYDGYEDEDPPPDAQVPSALEALARQPIRKQLTHLKLPSIRSRQELERLELVASQMPALEEIEIVRAHYFKLPAKLATTTARFVRPAGWPWPAVAEIPEGDMLCVKVPGSFGDETIRVADAAAVMERRFEDLDADARYAWTRFWAFVDELGKLTWKSNPKVDSTKTWTDERTFPAALMVQALDACDVGGSGGWREFREVLRSRSPFAPGAVLTVHRSRDL